MGKILKNCGEGERRPGLRESRRVPAEVYGAARRARDVLAAAEEDARRIRAEAEAERDRLRAEAVAAGREEGLAESTALLARASRERDRLLLAAERELAGLAVAVAERILGREVDRDAAAVVEIAARALEGVRQRREIALRVHPADAAALRAAQPRLVDLAARARCVEIREDARVGRGGVVVETEAGVVDARLETQLAVLRRVLEEEVP